MNKDDQNLPPPQTEAEYLACVALLQNYCPTTPQVARALNAYHGLITDKFAGLQLPPNT